MTDLTLEKLPYSFLLFRYTFTRWQGVNVASPLSQEGCDCTIVDI